MARLKAAAAICISLVIAAVSAGTAEAKAVHRGFIRMQDGLFVDQECREFNFVGANACVLLTAGCTGSTAECLVCGVTRNRRMMPQTA